MFLKIETERLVKAAKISMEKCFPSKEYVIHDRYRQGLADWYDTFLVTCIPMQNVILKYGRTGDFVIIPEKEGSDFDEDVEQLMFSRVHLMWANYDLTLIVLEDDMQKFKELYQRPEIRGVIDLANFISGKDILLLDFILYNYSQSDQ